MGFGRWPRRRRAGAGERADVSRCGLEVRFADNAVAKAKKMQRAVMQNFVAEGDEYGKAKGGKGKGKDGPYGKNGKVQFGNLDPNLPEDIKVAVDSVLVNLG